MSGKPAGVAGSLSGKPAGVAGSLSGKPARVAGRLSGKPAGQPGGLSGKPAGVAGRLSGKPAAQSGGLTRELSGESAGVAAQSGGLSREPSGESAGQAAQARRLSREPAGRQRAGGRHQQVPGAGEHAIHQPAELAEERVGDVHCASGAAYSRNRQRVVGKKWLLGSGRGDAGAKPDGGDCCQCNPHTGCHSGQWSASCRTRKRFLGQRNTPQIRLRH